MERNGSGSWIGGGGGGRDTIQDIRVDPQMQVIEIFRELMTLVPLENLHFPMAVDGR